MIIAHIPDREGTCLYIEFTSSSHLFGTVNRIHDMRNKKLYQTIHPRDVLIAVIVSSAALIVYLLTITPSLSYLSPDGSELATVPAILGLAHSPGYPVYTWLGYLFSLLPVRDVAFRINLMSAVMAAMATGGLYLVGIRLLPDGHLGDGGFERFIRRTACAGSSLALAFSPTFWSQALIAEVYTTNAAFIVFTLLALLRWERTQKALDFFWFALLLGLSSGTHISTLGFGLGMAIFVLMTSWRVLINWRWWLAALAGFGLGIAQYAWLPLKAFTLNDAQMLRAAPTTWQGFYNYTLGAFSQMRFAFSLGELPGRLVLYFSMLIDELGWFFLALGAIGLFSLLLRRPRHFFLLVGMYLVHIWFFMQYSVFDLNVFYIPAHMIWSLLTMFGALELFTWIERAWQQVIQKRGREPQWSRRIQRGILAGACAAALLTPAGWQVAENWQQNDYSRDTAINDFYANVWQTLPDGATLLTDSGVFGYDAFYWRLVYNMRSDVFLPALEVKTLASSIVHGEDLYSTSDGFTRQGPGALPGGKADQAEWRVPILFGETPEVTGMGRSQLVLYKLSDAPPDVTDEGASPDAGVNTRLDGYTLEGASIKQSIVESGGYMDVWLYWRLPEKGALGQRTGFMLHMSERALVSATVGLGLLPQLWQAGEIQAGGILVDKLRLVVPATMDAGAAELTVTDANGQNSVVVGQIMVANEMNEVDGWLQNAGR